MAYNILEPPGKHTDMPRNDTYKDGFADLAKLDNNLLEFTRRCHEITISIREWSGSVVRERELRKLPLKDTNPPPKDTCPPFKPSVSVGLILRQCDVPLAALGLTPDLQSSCRCRFGRAAQKHTG